MDGSPGQYIPLVLLLVLIPLFVHPVFADIRPPETAETQLISTFTDVQVVGTFTRDEALVWRQSNEALDRNINSVENEPYWVGGGMGDWSYNEDTGEFEYTPGEGDYALPYPSYPIHATVVFATPEPPLNDHEVQATISTGELTQADNGILSYAKTTTVDTASKTANMYNVRQEKVVGFSGSQTGRIVSEESALVDSAGNTLPTLDGAVMSCPWSSLLVGECTPPFCGVAEMGSMVNMREVSFSTGIDARAIAEVAVNGDHGIRIIVPVVDGPPTELGYGIELGGPSPAGPANGSVSAHVRIHALDGNPECATPCGGPVVDLAYAERTTASGLVETFKKRMHYRSGIACAGCLV